MARQTRRSLGAPEARPCWPCVTVRRRLPIVVCRTSLLPSNEYRLFSSSREFQRPKPGLGRTAYSAIESHPPAVSKRCSVPSTSKAQLRMTVGRPPAHQPYDLVGVGPQPHAGHLAIECLLTIGGDVRASL